MVCVPKLVIDKSFKMNYFSIRNFTLGNNGKINWKVSPY